MNNMVEVKTAELTGAALDWVVGVAEGNPMRVPVSDVVWSDHHGSYSPSTNWAQSGPLIDKYQLTVSSPKSPVHRNGGPLNGWNESGSWTACTWEKGVNGKRAVAWDKESPLVAACRAIVAAKLGDVVQVPAELVGGEA